MTTARIPRRTTAPPAPRRVGYLVAVAVNLTLLVVVNRFLAWGWPPFLTPSSADLLPVVSLSFGASVAVNLLWVWRDPPWLRSTAQIGLNLIAVAAAWRTWQVFPFDFSAYGGPWEAAARMAIAATVVGLVVATVVEVARLARLLAPGGARPLDPDA